MVTQWIIVSHKMKMKEAKAEICSLWTMAVCLFTWNQRRKNGCLGEMYHHYGNGCHRTLLGKHSRLCFYTLFLWIVLCQKPFFFSFLFCYCRKWIEMYLPSDDLYVCYLVESYGIYRLLNTSAEFLKLFFSVSISNVQLKKKKKNSKKIKRKSNFYMKNRE